MAIIARKFAEGKEIEIPVAFSTTVTANTFGTFSSGYLIPAVAGTAELKVLIAQTVTTGGADHTVAKCIMLDETVLIEGDTASTATQAMVGTKIDLTNASTINQAATSTKVFYVRSLVPGSTTKVLGNVVSKDA